MAQYFSRSIPNTKEKVAMVGLNTRTEPMAMIRAGFELLDTIQGSVRSNLPATVVLNKMARGTDLTRNEFEMFQLEYEKVFARPIMTLWGQTRTPIQVGVGGRHMPAKHPDGRDWVTSDWNQMNRERNRSWLEWISVEMKRRNWTFAHMMKTFAIEIPKFEGIEEQTELVLNAVPPSDDLLSMIVKVFLQQETILKELAEIKVRDQRIEELLSTVFRPQRAA